MNKNGLLSAFFIFGKGRVDYKIDEEELFRTKGQKLNMETDKTKSSILGKRNTT